MTIREALDKLIAASPTSSFLVAVDVWSHYHEFGATPKREEPDVKWRIYDAKTRESYYGPSLETAVAAALSGTGSLDEVEAAR